MQVHLIALCHRRQAGWAMNSKANFQAQIQQLHLLVSNWFIFGLDQSTYPVWSSFTLIGTVSIMKESFQTPVTT